MHTEQQLKASRKEIGDLKAALDEHAIVAITDPQGKITYVNDKFCAISKYSREELLGQDHRLINSGYHAKEFIRDLWTTISNGKVWKGEIKNKAKDGSFYWVATTIVPFLNEHGKPRQYVAIRADITEKKVAEERAVWLGSFPELNPNPIIEFDPEQGIIHYANPCATRLFPVLPALGFGHPILAGLRERTKAFTSDNIGLIRREIGVGEEYYAQTITYVPESRRVRVYCTNITERKRTEDQLKASLKEISDLKAALDEHAIVAITDPQGKITYVNDKFCAISKYSRAELLGQDHRLINSGHHSKQFIRDLWSTIAQGKVWKGEIKNRAKDGSFYWVDTTIVPFLAEQGKPRHYVAIRADITERKQAEEAARRSEARYHTLFDTLIEGFCIIEMVFDDNAKPVDYRFLEINPAFERQTGLHNAQGKLMRDLVPDHEPHWFEIYGKIALTGEPVHFENEAKALGRYYDVCAYRVGGPGSRKVAILFNDITERKFAEEKIHLLNLDLEKRVAERTAELESFSYSVSHDLRAPLRAMGGYARMIQDDFGAELPPEAMRKLERIQENASQMGQLIDGLLAFSRLSRQPLKKQRTAPANIVQRVLEELQPEQAGRQIKINTGNLPTCQADATLLQQVFANLIANALKYTRQRDVAWIDIGWDESNQAYFIKDNGAGFDMQYAGKLFGVFQRLHRADEFEGTGVGLAIVQRIIQRHGGRIWAQAEPDKGATFYFTLAESYQHV